MSFELTAIEKTVSVILIPIDEETMVNMLVSIPADWTEVLRFLGFLAEKEKVYLDTQKISELVRDRLHLER